MHNPTVFLCQRELCYCVETRATRHRKSAHWMKCGRRTPKAWLMRVSRTSKASSRTWLLPARHPSRFHFVPVCGKPEQNGTLNSLSESETRSCCAVHKVKRPENCLKFLDNRRPRKRQAFVAVYYMSMHGVTSRKSVNGRSGVRNGRAARDGGLWWRRRYARESWPVIAAWRREWTQRGCDATLSGLVMHLGSHTQGSAPRATLG